MTQDAIQPGQAWPGRAVTKDLLIEQWEGELRHRAVNHEIISTAFTEAEWEALDWNAREALHLNKHRFRGIVILNHFLLPQEGVNLHLLRSAELVIGAWIQFLYLPHVKVMNCLPSHRQARFILKQARGRLEAAMEKQASLTARKRALQQFSIRQWRVYQQMAALFHDLELFVDGILQHMKEDEGREAKAAVDALWHSRELLHVVGGIGEKPSLWKRTRSPRLRINRLLGYCCLYHSALLRTAMHKE